ncbi:MAG: hypothetical protein R2877_04780 [Bdellovibrionota bacterium]
MSNAGAMADKLNRTEVDKFPPQIKYIIGNEVCERYSFYGMRSILTMFMIQALLFTKGEAEGIYHYFVSMAYFTPLIGDSSPIVSGASSKPS